ncbi:MAG: hypothetical protein K8R58_10455 [Bacteroidales bacterium]|nr:hypothetical protein [Bacteroidales bacterium]
MTHISIIGSGSIGTALGNVLSVKDSLNVTLLSIENDVVDSINNFNINNKYFPNIKLNPNLKATTDNNILKNTNIIFLAIPSLVTVDFVMGIKNYINQNAIILNLAKGFGKEKKTIAKSLKSKVNNPVCAFKGPTFARELINKLPTAFTLATEDENIFKIFSGIIADTNIYIDFSKDVKGVEILSILKNIYAIIIGIVDAHFNSPNLRFLILTRAFTEMKNILLQFGGKEETMFKYCGYGDFSLTALNDLSRNRTLGLLIGKGFFTDDISDKVLLEGKIAVNVFCEEISKSKALNGEFPLISELYKVFNQNYDVSAFVNNILKKNRNSFSYE